MSIDRQKVAEAAQKYTAKNQFDKAIAEYQRILVEDPNDVRVLLKVGDLQVRMNARTQAIETYSKVATTYDQQGLHLKAVAVYKQILQIDPGLLHLYNKLADLYVKLGLAPDAMQHLDALAQRYARAEDHANLAAVYRRMLQIDSSSIPTRIRFAELLSKLGRGDEAAAEFEAGCALLDTAGRVDEWARVAERLFFHRPTDVRVARKLAAYYLERSDAKRALPKLQICYKSNARDVVTLDLLASAFRALNQLPKTISVLKEIARIHNGEGKLKERNEVYQRVLELAPTDNEAREALRGGSHAARRPQSGSQPAAAAPQAPAVQAPVPPPATLSSKDPPRLSLEPPRVSQPSGPVLETVDEPAENDEVMTVEDGEEVIFESSQMPPRGETRASMQPPAPSATSSQAEGAPVRATSSVTPSFATPEEFGATQRDSMRPAGALATPFVHRSATTPPPSATSSSPPRAGGNVTEAARLLGEAEIFLKYGLKAKASAHLAKASELESDSIDLHVRIRDLYVSMGDQGGVARECVMLAGLFESSDPTAALIEARRAVEADPNNMLARAMVERLQGAEEYGERGEESFIDEGAVVMSDSSGTAEEPSASAAEGYSDGEHPAYDQPYPSDGYDYAGDATEIGESPVGSQSQEFYGYEAGIRVEVEEDYPQPPRSSYPGARREIEEGLDEAEFFITQGLYDDARDTLYQLLEMHPNHPLVLERIEEVEQLMQVQTQSAEQDPSYGLAEKLAEEVDGLDPMDGGPPTGQIDVETVLAQFKQGIGRTVSIEDCDTHYDLGIAYKEMGLLDDAIAEFQIATLNPGRQCIGETMIGLCFMEKGDITSAVEHFKAGLQAPQRNEREELGLYFEMGAAYEYLGDLSEALYFFQKVDKRDPAFRNVRDRVQRLYAAVHSDPSRRPPGVEDVDRAFDELLKE